MNESSSAVANDPRYKQGHKFLNDKKYEEGIALFASIVESW
jgi:hypothetical protein